MKHKEWYTILAVDDAKDSLMLLEFDLKGIGYQVILADSGEQALQIIATTPIDLILLDLYMPGLSGLATLQQIKANPTFDHIPVIMLSASDEEDQVVAALELGASDYVIKPYIAKILLARIKNALVLMEKTKQLEMLANTDFLTKVNNRGSFENLVNKALSQAKRSDQCLSLAMFDLDYFKSVNDNYGHEAGDKALVEFAKVLIKEFRNYDIIGRVGGEEFAVCMPNTDINDAIQACERCRIKLETTPIEVEYDGKLNHISLTVSVGLVAECTAEMQYEEMLRHADLLLYQAKENGRNQIAVDDSQCRVDKGVIMNNPSESKQMFAQSSEKFPGIDYRVGVNNVLGDDSLFHEILLMFYQDHGNDVEKIAQAIAANEQEQVKHLVHTLKGVACSIGAMTLFESTKALDFAANEQQFTQYPVLFADVEQELKKVLSGIKQQLSDKL